jgi:hypothetical protein
MTGRETSKERGFGAPRGSALAGVGFGKSERQHRSLYCVAIGTDPAGREHRIKIREEGSSFAMIDSRRRCRVPAHRACSLVEEDIAREVAFVFRVKIKAFEYPEPGGEACPQRTRPSKSKYWKSWGRKTMRTRG